jgi:hypothetical protein
MDFSGKNIAVLDTIHGAREICKKLREVGAAAVAFNIYHNTLAPDVIDFGHPSGDTSSSRGWACKTIGSVERRSRV